MNASRIALVLLVWFAVSVLLGLGLGRAIKEMSR